MTVFVNDAKAVSDCNCRVLDRSRDLTGYSKNRYEIRGRRVGVGEIGGKLRYIFPSKIGIGGKTSKLNIKLLIAEKTVRYVQTATIYFIYIYYMSYNISGGFKG